MIASLSAGIVAIATLTASAIFDALAASGIVHLEGENQ